MSAVPSKAGKASGSEDVSEQELFDLLGNPNVAIRLKTGLYEIKKTDTRNLEPGFHISSGGTHVR